MAKEKKIKICPMSQMPEVCVRTECAWWDDIAGLCAITVIARYGEEGSFYRQRQEQKEALDSARGT